MAFFVEAIIQLGCFKPRSVLQTEIGKWHFHKITFGKWLANLLSTFNAVYLQDCWFCSCLAPVMTQDFSIFQMVQSQNEATKKHLVVLGGHIGIKLASSMVILISFSGNSEFLLIKRYSWMESDRIMSCFLS